MFSACLNDWMAGRENVPQSYSKVTKTPVTMCGCYGDRETVWSSSKDARDGTQYIVPNEVEADGWADVDCTADDCCHVTTTSEGRHHKRRRCVGRTSVDDLL